MKTLRIFVVLLCTSLISCTSAVEYYVSPTGNDAADGSKSAPWKTWHHAQQVVRDQKNSKPVTVYFFGGEYAVTEAVKFSPEDSGTEKAPVRYAAVPGETPVFTGGVRLTEWEALSDPAVLERLDPAVHGKIRVADLQKLGITDYGDPTDLGKRPELFCDGNVQTLSRWPNGAMTHAGKVRGTTDVGPNWADFEGFHEGIFEYKDARQNKWAEEADPRLFGYWFWDWAEEFQRIDRFDTRNQVIYIQQPYHEYGYKHEFRYFGLNLLCELDAPGEWYLDREKGRIYWYPESPITSDQEIILSVYNEPFFIEMNDCSYITLEGLTLQELRGSGIQVTGGNNCLIEACRLQRLGRDGIHIEGGSNHGISRSYLNTLGCGGIRLIGGDRKNLIPANHFVENTVVENFSLVKRTYEPAVYMEGCGNRISNGRFVNSSSSAFRLEGNDLIVEYNDIEDVVNESDDQGGLDTWYNPSYRGMIIRYNRWSNIVGGTHAGAAGVRLDDMISGVLIYGNLFENCGSHMFGGVQINGGKDNLVQNNVFYKCPAGVSFTEPWSQERWDNMMAKAETQRRIYEEVDIRSELYLSRYPELADINTNANANNIENNLLIDWPQLLIMGTEKHTTVDNTLISSEGKPLDDFCTPEVLKTYGLEPIPVEKIGPHNNPWVRRY